MRPPRVILALFAAALLAPAVLAASTPAKPCQDDQQFYALFVQGQKAGFARMALQCRPEDDQVITSEYVELTFDRAGQPLQITVDIKTRESLAGQPLGFAVDQNLGAMLIKIRGKRQPDGDFKVVSSFGSFRQEQTMSWPQGALLTWGADLASQEFGLEPGVSYELTVFDPSSLQAIPTTITIGEKEKIDLLGRLVEATRITTTMPSLLGDTPMVSWCDSDFNLLRHSMAIMDMEIEMIACDEQFARADVQPAEIIDRILLASPRPLPGIHDASAATYELTPRPDQKISLAPCDNQTVQPGENGALLVTVRPLKAPAGVPFPYTGHDPEALAALQPGPYLQSDHPDVRALARQALGNAPDTAQAIARVEQFVGRYIDRKDLDVGYASAAEILQTRHGDCSEHAVLSATLLRAVGIPARVVVGYVYVDEWIGNEHIFGGHAWTEAFVDGQWIGLDATRCQSCDPDADKPSEPPLQPTGYSPAHLRLTAGSGEPADFTALLEIDRRFTIASVELNP